MWHKGTQLSQSCEEIHRYNYLVNTPGAETFEKMYWRLKKWNVTLYVSDRFGVYRDFFPPELLVQTKSETHLIESNNFPQRHWFARFRRKTCCVSRSLHMIDLTMWLYAAIHVNKSINIII